jgi:hypothetical protein
MTGRNLLQGGACVKDSCCMKNDVLVHGMVEYETVYLLIMDSEPSSTVLTLNIT